MLFSPESEIVSKELWKPPLPLASVVKPSPIVFSVRAVPVQSTVSSSKKAKVCVSLTVRLPHLEPTLTTFSSPTLPSASTSASSYQKEVLPADAPASHSSLVGLLPQVAKVPVGFSLLSPELDLTLLVLLASTLESKKKTAASIRAAVNFIRFES